MKSFILNIFFLVAISATSFGQLNLNIQDGQLNSSDELSVPVTIEAIASEDVVVFQFSITWDVTLIQFESVSLPDGSFLSMGNFGFPSDSGNMDKLVVGWENYPNTINFSNLSTLFTLHFSLLPNTSFSATNILFCPTQTKQFHDENLERIVTTFTDGEATISALKVHLMSFTAESTDQKEVLLKWRTANEQDNAYIAIERSSNGKNWTEINRQIGVFNSNTQNDYKFLDVKAETGINVYRLKQVDTNGQFIFSEKREVMIEDNNITFFGNPVNNILHFNYSAKVDETISLYIFDTTGKLIKQKSFDFQKGFNQKDWNVTDVPTGVYLIKGKDKNSIFYKLIKS